MRIISPVTVELTDAELVTIKRALEIFTGMGERDPLTHFIGAVAETGSTFTLATKATIKGADLIESECPDPTEIADELMANMSAKKTGAA